MNLKVIAVASGEGGFAATVPAFRGCISEDDTREDAPASIREATELYFEPVD